tara:strand:- start:298 stop:1425 length:1128 start_codon:yes stop_codon:yes gene_type:complete
MKRGLKISYFVVSVSLLIWFFAAILFIPYSSEKNQAYIIITIVAVISCTTVSYTYSKNLTIFSISASCLSLAVSGMLLQNSFGKLLALCMVVLCIIMIMQAVSYINALKSEYISAELNRQLLHENEQKNKSLMQSARMASIGEMAAAISHEVNNPLAIISSTIDIIRIKLTKKKLTDEELKVKLEKITKTIERTTNIVRNLSKIARDGAKVEPNYISLGQFVEDIKTLFYASSMDNQVELIYLVHDEDLKFFANEIEVSQVIVNLFNNAIFEVSKIDNISKRWVKLETSSDEKNLVIKITDSGPGIPTDIRKKIMDPFFSTKGPKEGTGIGLSISKKMIESNNGSLRLEDSKETTFTVSIPLEIKMRDDHTKKGA